MQTDTFLDWLKHFANTVKPSPEEKHILILDEHSSHKSIEAVDFAREHGIIMITLRPHTTHRLQPLDVTIYDFISR